MHNCSKAADLVRLHCHFSCPPFQPSLAWPALPASIPLSSLSTLLPFFPLHLLCFCCVSVNEIST